MAVSIPSPADSITPARPRAAGVVTDPREASQRCRAGQDVVLVLPAGQEAPQPAGAPGRLAVFVGDPGNARDLEAAAEMSAELFGRVPPRTASE